LAPGVERPVPGRVRGGDRARRRLRAGRRRGRLRVAELGGLGRLGGHRGGCGGVAAGDGAAHAPAVTCRRWWHVSVRTASWMTAAFRDAWRSRLAHDTIFSTAEW